MAFPDSVAGDWAVVDGLETVAYTAPDGTVITVTGVDAHDVTQREVSTAAGLLALGDRRFALPGSQVAGHTPAPGGRITQADGTQWEITGGCALDDFGISWTCDCTRAAGTAGGSTPTMAASQFQAVNRSGSAFAAGQPVAVVSNGVTDASATGNTTPCAGLATTGAAALGTETVVTEGLYTLADWTAIVGSTSLTPGAVYYLSATAAKLSATRPTGSGNVVQAVGRAVSATTLNLDLEEPILLAS